MPKKNVDPDLAERKLNRQKNTGVSGSGNVPNPVAPDSGGGGGNGYLDMNSAMQKSQETGEVINPSHFATRREWQDYYDALPQEFKANYRQMRGSNEQRRNNFLSFGGL
jgi:hypothetical protein